MIQDVYYYIGLFHSYRPVGGELAVIRGGRELAIVARVWVEARAATIRKSKIRRGSNQGENRYVVLY